jgi:hypothetical protein
MLMNERIKQLAEQAGFVVGVSANADRQIKHFAELVRQDEREQAEKQEPVAYIDHVSGKPKFIDGYVVQTDYDIPLYTAPPKREWVGLTDDEIWDAYEKGMYEEMWFARAVEAKLKEKNT